MVVIATDFMMKRGKLKKAFYAGRESFSIADIAGTNESNEELEKEVEKGIGKRISLDEDKMTEKDKEHEKDSARVSNDGAMALELRDELVRKSIEMDGEGKSENEDETSETEESEGSICSSSIVFQDNTSNRLETLETNVTLVLKRLTKLEENDGNKSKNMELPFNQLLNRLSRLERENQSLQVGNEKLKIENMKLKESKNGKDFIKSYQNTKNVSSKGPSLFTDENTTKKTLSDKENQRQVRPRELPNLATMEVNDITESFPVDNSCTNPWSLSEYPNGYLKSATANKDEWQVPKARVARSTTASNVQPVIETKNCSNSLAGIRECNAIENSWGLSEKPNEYSNSTTRDQEGKRQHVPSLSERCNSLENHTEKNHEGPTDLQNSHASVAPQSSNYRTSANNTTQRRNQRNARNIVPGEHSYSEAVQRSFPTATTFTADPRERRSNKDFTTYDDPRRPRKTKVAIVGDSILRGIRRQDINREVKRKDTYVKTFPGATVEHMKWHVIPSLDMDPDEIIFMCGTNNLRNDHPNQVAKKIIELAVNTNIKVRKVAVSSIVRRADSSDLDVKRMNVS